MPINVTTLACPTCGTPATLDSKFCEGCGNVLIFSKFETTAQMSPLEVNKRVVSYRQALASEPDNTELNTSVAMCFLKLRQFDHALAAFEKVMPMNFDNSEVFFYAAVCLLQGKMPFLHLRPTIDKILSYMESALMIEQKGIYYYFLAYIKQDYFKRKYLNVTPNYMDHLAQAKQHGVTLQEINNLFAVIGTQRPAGL